MSVVWWQVLLEAMPSSWVAWSGRLAAAVDGLGEDRLWPLADALTLPRALGDIALTHAVLELVAPQELQSARTLGYFEEAKQVRRCRFLSLAVVKVPAPTWALLEPLRASDGYDVLRQAVCAAGVVLVCLSARTVFFC